MNRGFGFENDFLLLFVSEDIHQAHQNEQYYRKVFLAHGVKELGFSDECIFISTQK